MLIIRNILFKRCPFQILHHPPLLKQPVKFENILHQAPTVSYSDDNKSDNHLNKNKKEKKKHTSQFKKLPHNFSEISSLKYRYVTSKNNDTSDTNTDESDKPSIKSLLKGLQVEGKLVQGKFRKRKVIQFEKDKDKDKAKGLTGRDLYCRAAFVEGSTYYTQIMPKGDKLHLDPLRDIRRKKRKREIIKGVPHHINFQVLGNGTSGGGKSLFLYTDGNKYLFNCGEGTQRLALEYSGHKSLANLSNIFITRKSWENIGGLPGMFLSIRASGAPDVTINGPPGVNEIYQATKHFIVLHDFDVMFETDCDSIFEDQAIKVESIPLIPYKDFDNNEIEIVFPCLPKETLWLPDVIIGQSRTGEYLVNDIQEDKLEAKQGFDNPIDQTVFAFIVECKSKPGRLQIDKCIELGITPGPLLGELKAGRDVTLDNGMVVRSIDVMEDAEPPLNYIVVECPSPKFLPSLLNNEKLSEKIKNLAQKLQAIFHFTPCDVVEDDNYRKWMNSFSSSVKHIFLNGSTDVYGSHGIQGKKYKMHLLHALNYR